ncbi:DUF4293 family protein [Blattabacterium cuenoti]|uniref:DUF4293 family protein n=1 Tax=Blattabacterium cuenoti TaxID=1653831 RepID=UPI00163D27FA|nr:DUF4293 family protein [Blattabacterium cuenoti]
MLYRIQTLYLFISIFIYFVFIYFLYPLNINFNQNLIDFFYLYLCLKKIIRMILIICLSLSIFSFFLFKKKKLQIFINKINILFNTIHVLILFFSDYQLNKYEFSSIITLLSLCICVLCMSNIAIKKDIKLIDSINRIR